jgi:hypothetical protein
MSRWFRVYDDVINDPKLLKLPEALRWQWLALLCVASKNGGKLPANDDIALLLRVPEAKAAEFVTKLVKAKLIDNIDGVFVPHNWDGRQFKSDTSNDRVKKHRDGKRNVTLKQECNVTGGVTETAPEAEAKADTESEQSRADTGAPIDEDFGRKVSVLTVSVGLAFTTRGFAVPPLNRCTLWLQQGYAQGTILGAVDRVLKRGRAIATLDYFDAAIAEDHAKKPVAAPRPEPEIDRSNWFIIVEGTLEHTCWNIIRKEQKLPPLFLCNQIAKDGSIYERAAKCPTLFPVEFNDFGERLEPAGAENAA